MLSSPIKKFILIIILVLAATYISLPSKFFLFGKNLSRPDLNIKIGNFTLQRNFDLHLGLDLAGGSHLVFEADTSGLSTVDKKDAVESLKNIIEGRINGFGLTEPSIQTSSYAGKDRIVVELPGINDTQTAVSIIGKTAKLEFREFSDPTQATIGATLANTKPTGLTGADFKKATPGFGGNLSEPIVSFEIKTGDSAKKFGELTTRLIGKPLAIFLDNIPLSWPTVQQTITDSGQISGNFTVEGTKNLAKLLNAGALPVPVKLVEERTVGATLGALSVNQSILAGVVGVSMVGLFMILAYGKLGLVADAGLFVFAVITLALYKLIPVTITLPGIAGFMLSVGMAVDSNILIFERFKEEKDKRSVANALEVSFGRAWDSIRDANVATIITSLVLINPLDWSFLQSSGPVRGFAITLLLGILISLFTGIFVSRNLLRVFVRGEKND